MMKKLGLLLLLPMLLLAACGTADAEAEPAVRTAAEDMAEEAPAQTEAEAVTELDLSGQDISVLDTLAEPEALQVLNISGLEVADFTVLNKLSGLRQLDARGTGMTVEAFEALSAALPDCEILWEVPIAGQYYDCTKTVVTLPDCTADDLALLDYLPQLQSAVLLACTDDEAAYSYAQNHPEQTVVRAITLCGTRYLCEDRVYDLSGIPDVTPDSLQSLRYLGGHAVVDLRGTVRTPEEMQAFTEAYPEVEFRFSFKIAGVDADWSTELLILNYRQVSKDTVCSYIPYLPNVTQIEMCRCGLSNATMAELRDEYPEIKFVWMLTFAREYSFRTDVTAFSTLAVEEDMEVYSSDCEIFQYCTDLKALDLGHCTIRSIEFLRYLPELRVLILADNHVSDLSPIASLKNLTYLEIFMNYGVTTLEPLKDLTYLRYLNVCWIGTSDYSCLYDLPQLEMFWYYQNGITTAKAAEISEDFAEGCDAHFAKSGYCTEGDWRGTEVYTNLIRMFRNRTYNDFFEPHFEETVEGD